MGYYDEWKKKRASSQSEESTDAETEQKSEPKSYYQEWMHKNKSSGYYDWLKRVGELSDTVSSDYDSRDGKYQSAEDFGKYYSDKSAQIQGLLDEGQGYLDYFAQYSDVYSDEFRDYASSKYTDVSDYLKRAGEILASENEMWSQFENEEEYLATQMLTDFDAAGREIERLQGLYDMASEIKYKPVYTRDLEIKKNALKYEHNAYERNQLEKDIQQLESKIAQIEAFEKQFDYSKLGDLEKDLAKRKKAYDLAKGYKAYEEQVAAQNKLNEEYLAYDDQAGLADIDSLKSQIAGLKGDHSFWDRLSVAATELGMDIFRNDEAMERDADIDELEALVSEKMDYHDKATAYQRLNKLITDAQRDEDFDAYAKAGMEIENPSPSFWSVKEDDVGNIVTYSRDNVELIESLSADRANVTGDSKYAEMTEDEVKVYSYYLAKFGKETAQEYLDLIDADLIEREKNRELAELGEWASQNVLTGLLASAGSVLTSLGSGVEYVGDVLKYGVDQLKDPYTAKMDTNSLAETTNTIRGAVTEKVNLEIDGWDAFDFVYNTAMSGADSFAAAYIPGGAVVLGLSAAAQGTNDALERGLSSDQAFWNGVVNGTFEMLFESVSIGQFKGLQEAAAANGREIASNIAKSMLVNASEETCTEVANVVYDILANGDLSNYEIMIRDFVDDGMSLEEAQERAKSKLVAQVFEAGASGALMGAGFGGFGSAVGYKNNKTIGAKYASDPSILIESALELDKNNKRALELKAKLDANQTISNAELGALKLEVNELRSRANADMNDQKRTALRERIEKRLGARISDKTERAALAEDLTDIIRGNSVSDRALRGIVKNQAALNILNDALGTRFKASDKLTVGGVRNDIKRAFSGMQSAQQDAISILKLNESERTVLSEVMPAGLDDAQQLDFTAAFSVVYRAAMSGKDIGSINSSIVAEAGLTQNQIQEIYYRGRIDYLQNLSKNNSTKATPEFLNENKVEESQKKIDAAKRSDGKKKKGAVIYDGDRSKLSDMQKKSLEVLDKISEALGVTFHIYESRMINGKYVYEKPNGVKTSANGWYDTKTGEIWLDINAGNNGEGVMIFTAAHELTHFIKQWSPAKFKIFADFLIEQYQDHNISVDELVRRQIDKAKKNGRTLTRDQAYEEVIADSCESFLRDSDAVEKIVELNQKDAGLAAKIKQFIGNMLKRLRELMKGINPQSREGQIVVDMTSALEQLHKLWTDALADAGEAYSVIGAKDSDVDSGYRFAERDYPIDHDVEKVVNQALTKSNSSMHNLSPITSKQIKRIHRLGTPKNDIAYRGKFEGGNHLFSDIAIRHIISEHGDFLREALRAQLPMTPKDIARHLSAIKSDKEPSNIIPTRTGRGQASILTSYEVNGYTLFAEEITKKTGKNLPSDLIGHTMYKAPTLATAHFYATSAQTQPKRQSTVLCNYYTPNSKNLSIGNFVQNSEGKPAQLNYLSVNGTIKQDPKTSGLIALSSDASNFTDKSGKVEQGYVRCQKPFYITANNRVFSNSKTNASEKIEDLKKQGYDCFIFEKTPGDNYMVAVVNKAQIIKDVPTVADGSEMHSDRDSNHSEAALEQFGTTADFDMTGFVLEDGQMLKLSPYGLKGVNHSLIAKVYDGIKGSAAVNRFIQEGNVRIKASSPGIEISSEKDLTVSQYNIVSRFISRALRNRGVFYVDITDVNGNEVASITYDEDASAEEIKYDIKNYYRSGRLPKRSDFFFSERDPDAPTNRELLVNALETDNMSPSEKGFLTKYKNKIAQIEANEAEISNMKAELKELQKNGKGKTAKAISLEGKISTLEKQNGVSERLILNLEATKPIRELLRRERDAAYKKAVAEGREKLAEYKDKVKKREKEIRQGYREARKKSVEGRSKTAVRHKIANVVAELDKLLRHGNKKSNVKIGLQSAVASALEVFDHNSDKVKRYQKSIADLDARIAAATDPVEIEALTELRDKKKRNSERLSDKLQVMKKAYEDIHNGRDGENYPSYYKAEAEAIENRIAEVIEKVGDTSIGDMSLDQLEAVYGMYRMVLTTVQNANKVFRDGKLADLTEDATEMENELQRIKKLPEERLKAGDSIRGFVWNELTPYYAFNRIGSRVLMGYYDELVRGQDVYARDITEAKDFAEETRAKHGYGKWKLDKVHHFKDKDGRNFDLTLKHMMSIYAYSKREQALDHMEKGGFFFNNKETFRKKGGVLEFIASNESGYKVDAQVFAMIKSALTAEQIAYVDEMQEYLTLMGEKGNKVSRVMWGIDIFKEKVYFPLKSKEDFIYQANTPAETSSLKNDGMTKETRPHASNPIVLEAFDDVWASHVNKMSTYHGFVVPIDNLNKLVNYGTWIESKKITPGMSDAERYDALKDRVLSLSAKADNDVLAEAQKKLGLSDGDIEYSKYGDKKRLFKKLGEEFSVYQKYSNEDIHLDFTFSKGNMGESVSKQGRNFLQMAKMLTCLDEIVENAIGIEVHNRNQDGYKADSTLENVYVLASTFVDGENIVPVKLEIKKFSDKENTLYVAIALESIKTDGIVKQEVAEDGVAQQYSPPSNISIAQFFEKINVVDKSFLKYIPDGFLNAEQIEAKKQALEKDGVKYSPSLKNDLTSSEMGAHSISTMLEARFGSGVNEYLNTFIKDLNGAKAQNGTLMSGVFNLLSKFKKTAVAASLSVVVQQPTAIIRALSEIDIKRFAHLPKLESLNRRWELIQEYAPIAIIKDIGGFDTGSGRTTVEWLNSDTKRSVDKAMNKIDDLTMYGAALGDRIGWSSIWVAVEREVQAKQGLEYGSDEFYAAVGKRFTEVIVKTQVYDSTLSRSGFMRGKDGLMKMATAFMGEPTLSVNMMIDAVLQAKRGRIKAGKAARTIASVYTATLAASIVKSFIYALRDDDDDESYAEKYLQAFGGTILNDINPMNMLPLIRDAVSIFDGWDVERTDMALVADLKNAIDALDSDSKNTWRKIEDFAGAIAAFAGVPLKNAMRTAREMYNLVENVFDGIHGGNLGGAFVEGVTGKEMGKSESLYGALINGDTERIEIYKKTYKSEAAYQSAVRRALRENDRRVQQAVEGVLSGKSGIYSELKNDVRAEKHFDVKTVNEAFADEREYVLGKLNDARKARREGDTAEYNKIVEQLIKRGYSEEFVKRKLK